jgi:hypothetical protein
MPLSRRESNELTHITEKEKRGPQMDTDFLVFNFFLPSVPICVYLWTIFRKENNALSRRNHRRYPPRPAAG